MKTWIFYPTKSNNYTEDFPMDIEALPSVTSAEIFARNYLKYNKTTTGIIFSDGNKFYQIGE